MTGVESDGAWDFTIPVGVLRAGRVGCNLAFIDGDGETYSRNVVFLVEPAVSGVFDPEDGQQTRLDKIIGTVQDAADTAIDSINKTASDAVDRVDDAVEAAGQRLFYAYPYPPDSGCCVIEYPAFLGYNGNTGVYINLETEE